MLVPKHLKVKDKEKQAIYANYNISFNELPKILKNDAVLKNMKVKPGDIIKIVRKSPTAGEFVFYRGVIDA